MNDQRDDADNDADNDADTGDDTSDELEELGGESSVDGVIDGESLTYDLAAWSRESRSLLDSLLGSNDIHRGWQGTTLLVRVADAEAVDRLKIEAEVSAAPSLDRSKDLVEYVVGGWSAGTQTRVADELSEADISYEWNENGDLVVYADDEDAVDAIFDGIPTDDEEEGSDDGIVVTETLSRLWEATSALAHKPKSADAIVAVADTSLAMEDLALPFGFEPNVWHTLVDSAVALRMALENDDPDSQWTDEDLKEGATELRDLLRPYI